MNSSRKKEGKMKITTMLEKKSTRRSFMKKLSIAAAAGSAGLVTGGCVSLDGTEEMGLKWEEYFKKNYRLMTQEEKDETVARLERLFKLQHNEDIQISNQEPQQQWTVFS